MDIISKVVVITTECWIYMLYNTKSIQWSSTRNDPSVWQSVSAYSL